MNENEIKQKLDQLAEFQSERDVAMLEKQRLLDEVCPAEIKSRMAEIEAEFSGKTEAVNENIAALEAEIKAYVIELAKEKIATNPKVKSDELSIKASFLHAVFSKGKPSYSEKEKDGYMPVSIFRKEGEPSVSIRVAK